VPVRVRYLTDPACPASWAHEPVMRRLEREFGEGLSWTYVMGGLAREFGSSDDQSEPRATALAAPERLLAEWLDTAGAAGMPCDPLLWRDGPLSSSYPACLSVKAAAEQGTAAAAAYLRMVREGLFCYRRKLDTTEALVEEARRAGLDVERFRIDLGSHAIVEAFGADLEEVREVPEAARAEGAVERSGRHERLPFPTLVFVAEDRGRHAVYGRRSYQEVRAAALAAGAEPLVEDPPDPLGALRRFGRLATPEVAAACELAEPPTAAELWRLHVAWKVTRTPVLCGELWQAA
jgi:predicted DsbA family dithiol-disulfide isomerase